MHAEVGAYGAQKGVGHLIFVGSNAKHMAEAAKESGSSRVTYIETLDELKEKLGSEDNLLPEGCTVLIKASHGMHFSEVVELLSR